MHASRILHAAHRARQAVARWLHGPGRCLLCHATLPGGLICTLCRADLPWSGPACGRCASRLSTAAAACGRCMRRPPAFHRALCPLDYRFPVDQLVQAFKFRGDMLAGRLLAELMADVLEGLGPGGAQVLVPLPLHRRRLRQRGFNQAAELARVLGQRLGLPVDERMLRRSLAGPPQSGLSGAARRSNVRGAFCLDKGVAGPPARVALVDDVLTTGATASEAARALLAAGAQEISIWTVARTVPGAGADLRGQAEW